MHVVFCTWTVITIVQFLLQVSSIDCGITGRFIVHGGHQLGLVIATGYVHCLKFIQFVNFSACMLYGRWHLVSLG